jgi:DNA-binding LacI/PurR family transcriptional regulator
MTKLANPESPTKKIKQPPLHRSIYETLRDAIRVGTYQDGDRLPSESALCEQFGASRITVAKAVHNLQREGLVVRRPGSGSYIQAPKTTSFRFGLLIPELGSTEIFEPICRGIMQSPLAKSHVLVWGHSPTEEQRFEEEALNLCRQFISQKVSGVFFAPVEFTESKDATNDLIVAELRRAGIPIILLDRGYRRFPLRSNLDRVAIDNFRAGYTLTQHLWQQGARRIIFVARKLSADTVIERVSGYYSALRELGSDYAGSASYGDVSEPHFVQKLLAGEAPDAIICGNDLTAARLMRTLINFGVRIPQEIRMAGFDDVSYSKFLPVPLTTIHQNCSQMGEVAMELMMDRMKRPERHAIDVLVPFELVVRESCGPASTPDEANLP